MVEHCKRLRVQYRPQPRQSWHLLKNLGKLNGGLNASIAKVSCSNPSARGMVFIEKRFGAQEFKYRVAHREIQLLHQISDHMNIVTMVDHFLDKGALRAAVYLEYCDLGSLDAVVYQVAKGRHVHERKVWSWFFQLCGALTYCHWGPEPSKSDDEIFQSGWSRIYHRDVKPGNVLLTKEGGQIVVKLADFGCGVSEDHIAQAQSEQLAIKQQVGTPGFDAPEYPFFGGASDVWQLGVTMMCLCTGTMSPKSRMNSGGQIWDKSRPAGDSYSGRLNSKIKLCMATRPQQRSTSYQILQLLDQASVTEMSTLSKDRRPLALFKPYDRESPPVMNHMPAFESGPEWSVFLAQGGRQRWNQMNAPALSFF